MGVTDGRVCVGGTMRVIAFMEDGGKVEDRYVERYHYEIV